MLFRVENAAAERASHCGVLEFVAEEGRAYLPRWVRRFCWLLVVGVGVVGVVGAVGVAFVVGGVCVGALASSSSRWARAGR